MVEAITSEAEIHALDRALLVISVDPDRALLVISVDPDIGEPIPATAAGPRRRERAGRRHLVRTLADLAAQQGLSPQRYRKVKPYEAAGFPPRISSAKARTRLYDGDQVDAYLLGKPVPALPDHDDDNDLLDRQEAAAELGVSPAPGTSTRAPRS
ncbi:hypothetical protein [Streptomyces microflavus]|uniref:hypothetical protein n=1 Tax=Streptomyces microflavus TaxID=1919 RepID=UPI003B2249AB